MRHLTKINSRAWEIRRDAAKRYNVGVMVISWRGCFLLAMKEIVAASKNLFATVSFAVKSTIKPVTTITKEVSNMASFICLGINIMALIIVAIIAYRLEKLFVKAERSIKANREIAKRHYREIEKIKSELNMTPEYINPLLEEIINDTKNGR